MTDKPEGELEALLAKQALLNVSLEQIERDWKNLRLESRRNAMALITKHGISLARTAEITGHHRNTLKVWLDVHNAEEKGRADRK